MKRRTDIRKIGFALIIIIVFAGMMTGCATTPKLQWTKPTFTQQEWATDNYECMQQSQQRQSSADEGYYIGNVYFPGGARSRVVTNPELHQACMEARGWRLVEARE